MTQHQDYADAAGGAESGCEGRQAARARSLGMCAQGIAVRVSYRCRRCLVCTRYDGVLMWAGMSCICLTKLSASMAGGVMTRACAWHLPEASRKVGSHDQLREITRSYWLLPSFSRIRVLGIYNPRALRRSNSSTLRDTPTTPYTQLYHDSFTQRTHWLKPHTRLVTSHHDFLRRIHRPRCEGARRQFRARQGLRPPPTHTHPPRRYAYRPAEGSRQPS